MPPKSTAEYHSWELALGLLFQVDVASSRLPEAVETSEALADEPEELRKLAVDLAVATVGQNRRIDRLIRDHLKNYSLTRLPAVDRNILRLSVAALTRLDRPLPLVLTLATKLARSYGGADSPRFISGVLRAIAASVHEGVTSTGTSG